MSYKIDEPTKRMAQSITCCVTLRNFGLSFVVGLVLSGWSTLAPEAHAQDGVPLWTNRYEIPAALAVDSSGNAVIAGQSHEAVGFHDYVTIKYSSAGVALWTNRYHGPGSNDDGAIGVAVDHSGSVFVTGFSFGDGTDYDYATIKYSSAGVPLWTNRYNGPADMQDYAVAIAVDGSSNVVVTGYSAGSTSYDYVTIKYSGEGVPLWTNCFNRPGDSADYAQALALDSSNDVVVTGYSVGRAIPESDYATVKYSSAGVALWTNYYNGPGNSNDIPCAVAVDGSGNVFVTGCSLRNGTDCDYATIKYSSTGMPLWTNYYNGPANSFTCALAVDPGGNVLVTGSSANDTNFVSSDYATIKYTSSGVALWTNRYAGETNALNQATAIAVDRNGNVFVTGFSLDNANSDYGTVKYSSAGKALWTNRYDSPPEGFSIDVAYAIALDSSGDVFVTGSTATIKYSSSPSSVHLTIEPDGSGGYFIRFTGSPGDTYRLQRATRLTGPWTTSASQTVPASGVVEFWDIFPPPGQAFYRTVQP